ncbi:maltose alpha-D-glucosyltransferase [Pseudomonas sp. gcc21]|uniref:maltose alpha-D-glucosyltransferase n=1 Tax=Pseudomonas sp. gcc21 TaxID=2726989 RepID=UPI001451AEED|nr:maltose alpha-D-glucosyltransferase [Pseudomonas sp. gcc21]QJD60520.1 maltose alpha-D-glucosyltransferase [Pseudomonas sp. gcc21]
MPKKQRSAAFIDDPLWYKDAVIYQVHVKSFFDSNNDGIGDFQGLIAKLDYIADLGVNTIWLLPFYPSPRRDDGYDISDYRKVHPDYGRMADAKRFIAEAHKRGLRVISELVINHTSDQHPWFQRARRAKPGSAARNYYVWSDTDEKYDGTRIIFLDTETSNWTWDPVAGQYFWHRFYSHQPDLNFDNPQVLKEVLSVMRFWLDLGVDGLRLDAIPYLIERDGTNNENLPETHVVLKKIRAELDRLYPDRMLLAEANQWPEDTQMYFGGNEEGLGDECHMAFHFPLMPRMYMAIAQEDRFPITDILRQTPDIPSNCQWAIFLRNHDELTLEMVTDRERDYLWNYYAADRRARINLGIRRRLAPLVERDRRRIELLNSLLLSMPGTPTLYYGDELGMGDNIFIGDRDGVRTPMQWSADRNGGFSRADPASLVLPPIQDPLYGYQTINVEAQSADPHSLLNWTRRMLAVRKQQKAFGRGTLKMLAPPNRRILAYLREYTDEQGQTDTILCVANVSRAAQAVELDLSQYVGKVPVEMIGGSAFPPIGQLSYLLTLPPYGFYWFLLAEQTQMPSWHIEPPERMPEMATLVLKRQLQEVLDEQPLKILEKETLPAYLPKRRWFAGAGTRQPKTRILYAVPFGDTAHPALLSEVEVKTGDHVDYYQLPLGFIGEDDTSVLSEHLAMARIRRGRQVGLLTDAFTMESFIRALITQLRDGRSVETERGALAFQGSEALSSMEIEEDIDVRYLSAEQSNSSVILGGRMVLKLIRHLHAGIHPELEMGAYLTDHGFENCAPMLGQVTRTDPSGESYALMVLQGYLDNQGDAWEWTLVTLDRAIRDQMAGGLSQHENQYSALAELEEFSAALGQRLGEMHVALSSPTDNPDFASEPTREEDAQGWAHSIRQQLQSALDALEGSRAQLEEEDAKLVTTLQKQRQRLEQKIDKLAAKAVGGLRFRVHGDLHLGQVLVVKGDAYLIDFEGEPSRPLLERRAKLSPYKDVTGVLRSIDYAVAMACLNAQSTDSSDEAEQSREEIVRDYRNRSTAAFLQAYRQAAAEIAHDWADPDGENAALTLFSLEKAAYEILYETEHRPTWISVPLNGLAELVQQLEDDL